MRASKILKLAFPAGLAAAGAAAPAQVGTVDPNRPPPPAAGPAPAPAPPAEQPAQGEYQPVDPGPQQASDAGPPPAAAPSAADRPAAEAETNVPRNDVFNAAEGVFGKGAKGLAQMIEKLLKDQGEPTAYITGREAGGAFVFGGRYGSGTPPPPNEGDRPGYLARASSGFDARAPAPQDGGRSPVLWAGPSGGFRPGRSPKKVVRPVQHPPRQPAPLPPLPRRRGQRLCRRRAHRELFAPRRHRADPDPDGSRRPP